MFITIPTSIFNGTILFIRNRDDIFLFSFFCFRNAERDKEPDKIKITKNKQTNIINWTSIL